MDEWSLDRHRGAGTAGSWGTSFVDNKPFIFILSSSQLCGPLVGSVILVMKTARGSRSLVGRSLKSVFIHLFSGSMFRKRCRISLNVEKVGLLWTRVQRSGAGADGLVVLVWCLDPLSLQNHGGSVHAGTGAAFV